MEAYYTCSYIAALHSGRVFWLNKYTQYTNWTKNPDFAHCALVSWPHTELSLVTVTSYWPLIGHCDLLLTSDWCRARWWATLACTRATSTTATARTPTPSWGATSRSTCCKVGRRGNDIYLAILICVMIFQIPLNITLNILISFTICTFAYITGCKLIPMLWGIISYSLRSPQSPAPCVLASFKLLFSINKEKWKLHCL